LTSPTGLFVTLSGLIGFCLVFFMNKKTVKSGSKNEQTFEDETSKPNVKQATSQKKKK